MSRKVDLKRIVRLEAFACSMKVEDAKRRHVESLSRMSDEELVRLYLALTQIREAAKEDPCKGEELFESGLAATEHLEERARPGWRRLCETGAQAAVVDFFEATDGKVSPTGTPWDVGVLFEGNPFRNRRAGIRFHLDRLTSESERRDLRARIPRAKRW